MEPKIKLLKFSAEWCGYCTGMDRARTVEKFLEKHQNIELIAHRTENEGDAAEVLMDEYDVRGLPAFIFEDQEGNIVHQEEGATSLAGLEKMYLKATKCLETGCYGANPRPKRERGGR